MAVMNFIDWIGSDEIATKVGFFMLAAGILFVSNADRKLGKFFKLIFVFAVYHLIDELLGKACVVSIYEFIFAAITIYFIYGRNRN